MRARPPEASRLGGSAPATAHAAIPPPRPASRARGADTDPQRLRSVWWLAFFKAIMAKNLRQGFHAVRIARPGVPVLSPHFPVILYSNHPSWWDGALLPILATRLFPGRRAFGPIDDAALARYGFMRRLGLFGVEPGTYAGAATFLRVGRSVLASPDALFCVTPQGRFVDPRERPVRIERGLSGLISVVPRVSVVPVALEYPFWSERTPEALVRFGEPTVLGHESGTSPEVLRETLQSRLVATMDRLRDDAVARDPARFEVLIHGRVGVGGVYDGWRRLRAWSLGQRFDPAHAPEEGNG